MAGDGSRKRGRDLAILATGEFEMNRLKEPVQHVPASLPAAVSVVRYPVGLERPEVAEREIEG